LKSTPPVIWCASELSRIHSIHNAILRRKVAVTAKQVISTGTCRRLPELRETGFAVQKSAPTRGAAVSALSVSDEKPRKIRSNSTATRQPEAFSKVRASIGVELTGAHEPD
jgi:hypothetical protein